jgi:hypothetical protein
MARIDIEIEEYLDEVRTELLFRVLKKRKDFDILMKDYIDEHTPEYLLPELETGDQVLRFIKIVLRLNPWHDKKRIIQEIESL